MNNTVINRYTIENHNTIIVEKTIPTINSVDNNKLITVLNNFHTIGYTFSKELYEYLANHTEKYLINFYKTYFPLCKTISGHNCDFQKGIIYKNFPDEVLNMTESEYWKKQVMIYWYNEVDREVEVERAPLFENINLKVLKIGDTNTYFNFLKHFVMANRAMTKIETDQLNYFLENTREDLIYKILPEITFKENSTVVVNSLFKNNPNSLLTNPYIKTPIDVLRFVYLYCGFNSNLTNKKPKLNVSRSVRKLILQKLNEFYLKNNNNSFTEFILQKENEFKNLFYWLHANEFTKKYPLLTTFIKNFRRDVYKSYNSNLENYFKRGNLMQIMYFLESKPEFFVKNINKLFKVAKNNTDYNQITDFFKTNIVNSISESTKIKLYGLLNNINNIDMKLHLPNKGLHDVYINEDTYSIPEIYSKKLVDIIKSSFVKSDELVYIDPRLENVKINLSNRTGQTNIYKRGDIVDIDPSKKFVRSVNYWENEGWIDNGWFVLNNDFKLIDFCDWDQPYSRHNKALAYSGDVNYKGDTSKCQVIDVYFDKVKEIGGRFLLWSNLAYLKQNLLANYQGFSGLMLRENPYEGKIVEPNMFDIKFKHESPTFSKLVCYIDLLTMKLVYLDVAYTQKTRTLQSNQDKIGNIFKGIYQNLDNIPSYYDVLNLKYNTTNKINSEKNINKWYLYSDDNFIVTKENAENVYVYKQVNEKNTQGKISIDF